MTGIVGNSWSLPDFSPMEAIPSTVCLTAYDGGVNDLMSTQIYTLAGLIRSGELPVTVGRVYRLDDIVEAHRCMQDNRAGGKIVVLP